MAKTADVASGQTIVSAWGNEIRDRTRQVFATTNEINSWAAPNGTEVITLDTGAEWERVAGAWIPKSPLPMFSSAASRDTYWPNPANGATCFTTDTNSTWKRIGGKWVRYDNLWRSFTPTISQGGNLALNPAYGQFRVYGDMVMAQINVGINSAGTAGQKVIASLPPGLAYNHGAILAAGIIEIYTGTISVGLAIAESPGQVVSSPHAAGGGGWGNNPSTALKVGDSVRYSIMYAISI